MDGTTAGEAALVGALANTVSLAVTYPLTTITTRQQVEGKKKRGMTKTVSMQSLDRVRQPKWWDTYYAGLGPACGSTFVAMGIYFWFYRLVNAIAERRGLKQTPLNSLVLTSIAGSMNVMLTNPMWVVVTRMQTQKADKHGKAKGVGVVLEELLAEPAGVAGLWKGLLPSLLMVSNPAIVYMVYETLSTRLLAALRKRAGGDAAKTAVVLSSGSVFLMGALAKLVSTLVTFPMLVVKSRLQSLKNSGAQGKEATVKGVVDGVVAENGGWPLGVTGMYHGLQAKVVQTVLNAALMFVIRERLTQIVLKARHTIRQ